MLLLMVAPDTCPLPPNTSTWERQRPKSPPELITKAKPKYPKEALDRGLEGKVLIEAIIDTLGNIAIACIKYSSNEIFNEPALEAMYKTKFKPAIGWNGRPIEARIIMPFIFKLPVKEERDED
ncbi:MAG: energy transducer TonB [Thermotogae bacterium]|nr:energy transducer TonB [Thermotogota bacterium]